MSSPQLAGVPEWRQFLNLSEALLAEPNAAAQAALLKKTLDTLLGCQSEVWFVAPAYPLPGEPDIHLLPAAEAPPLVRQVYETHEKDCSSDRDGLPLPCDKSRPPRQLALPLLSRDYLLAILLVERHGGLPLQPDEIVFLEGFCAHAAVALQISRQERLKNWRYEQLSLVRSVSTQISNLPDLNQLCQRVTTLIEQTFHYYSVSIFTMAEDGTDLIFQAGSSGASRPVENVPNFRVKAGQGMVGTVGQTGEEILAQDVRNEPHYRAVSILPETRSEIALPLKVGERVVGVLDIQSNRTDGFHEIDLIVLRALANNVALAVEGTRLYTAVTWRAEQMEAIFEVSRALNSILDMDVLLDEVVEVIHKRFGYPYVHLFTTHWGRRTVEYVAGSGQRSEMICEKCLLYSIDDPQGIIPWVARTGQLRLVNDISQDPLYRPFELTPDETCSELCVPLKFADEVLGVLDIQSERPNAFDPADLSLFQSLASSIAVALRNASMYRTERWRRQVADSFREVASLIASNVTLEELLEKILNELERNLPIEAAVIWLLEDPQSESFSPLRPIAAHGIGIERLLAVSREDPEVDSQLHATLISAEPQIRQPHEDYGPLGKAMGFPQDYSSIAIPLRVGDSSLGILALAHQSPGRYGSEARAMITTFAGYAAVSIQNARLYAASQEQAWIATILLQVSEASQAINNINELLETMVRLTPLLAGIEQCAFFLWDETLQVFSLEAEYGLNLSRAEPLLLEPELPALARLRESRSMVFVYDASSELALPAAGTSDEATTLVLLPLLARGEILGAFLVGHHAEVGAFNSSILDQHNMAILQGIVHQTAVAVENIRLLETRQEEAYVTAVLLQVAQAVVSQNDLDDVLEAIVHLMPILVGMDACAVYLWDAEAGEHHAVKAYSSDEDSIQDILAGDYRPGEFALLDAAVNSHDLVVCPEGEFAAPPGDWPDLVCLPPGQRPSPRQAARGHWLMGYPLAVKGEHFGVLVMQENGVPAGFQERRVELITGVAQQVALAIQNERLKVEMVARERLEREIQLAREIQQTFLPSHLPDLPGWELDIRWQTARQVGGDFYDIIRLGKGRLGLVIADVSDKGLPAALYMTVARTLIRALQGVESPARVLERVNNLMLVDSHNGLFVTAVYAILSLEKGTLTYANAGHNRPLLLRAQTDSIEQLARGSMAMGVMEDIKYEEHVITIEPGDGLLFFTDGLTDATSPSEEMFGEERILQIIQQVRGKDVCQLLETLDEAVRDFRQDAAPSDDLTLLAIRRLAES
ncbi:MAG TPA: GAF domain-containing protein [Anaerolineaceae bacterium]|nr:GAF domain-containing protein [Anaerolineaceae bacterium]